MLQSVEGVVCGENLKAVQMWVNRGLAEALLGGGGGGIYSWS